MKYNSQDFLHAHSESSVPGELAGRTDNFRELIDAVPAVLWRADAQTFRFTFVTGYAETLLGYPSQLWTEPDFWKDHVFPEDQEWVTARRRRSLEEDGEYDLEYRMMSRDGLARWMRELGRMSTVSGNREIIGIISDLSKKRSGRLALAEDKLWLRKIVDTIPVQIWSTSVDGDVDFANARWRADKRIDPGNMVADDLLQIFHPDDREGLLKAWQEAVTNGTPYEHESRQRMGDGQYRWFLARAVPLLEDGKIVRWFGANTDIEGQKQAEEALRKSEQRWRQIFQNSRIGVALLDASLHFIETNDAYQKMVGYSADELQSITSIDMTYRDDVPACLVLTKAMVSGKSDHFEIEKRYVRKDGGTIWVHINGSSFGSDEHRLWVAMVEDITERKRLSDQLQKEHDRLRLLLHLGHQFVTKLDVRDFFEAVVSGIRGLAGMHSACILLPDPVSRGLTVYLASHSSYLPEGYTVPLDTSLQGKVFRSGKTVAFRIEDLPELCEVYRNTQWMQDIAKSEHTRTAYALPLTHEGQVIGVLFLTSRVAQNSVQSDLNFLEELAKLIAMSLSNALRYEQVNESREKLVDAKNYIEDQIRVEFNFDTIVGASQAIREVLNQVETVAPTDSTVLVLGETGTGKELIARAIHDRSRRSDQSFIKVDCSAIPGSLMESELFGHEKGSFTGATAQRLGRFEIADKGTIFLDEIGDVPLELQPKLLRVLQDQAFERLGSNRTRHVNVRIVAATHRNLEEMVDKGEFRQDLYYRLKVFPITIPALRDRPEDIPPLVRHYVAKYAQRMKKEINDIPAHAMEVFSRYPWPGNVRELQHFLERSVVLSRGKVLQAPLRELEELIRSRQSSGKPSPLGRTMEEIERESILQALRESNWVVGGPHGAAAKLGLKRTTLASRMESLGISRHQR